LPRAICDNGAAASIALEAPLLKLLTSAFTPGMEPDLVVARICCLVSRILLQTPAAFFGLLARAAPSVPVRRLCGPF